MTEAFAERIQRGMAEARATYGHLSRAELIKAGKAGKIRRNVVEYLLVWKAGQERGRRS